MDDVPRDKQLIPAAIDFRAQHSPQRIYAYLPKGETLQEGFFPLKYSALAKAVNATAWWLDENLGGPLANSEVPTVAYTGANDFRYALLQLAASKTKRKLMTPLLYNTKKSSVRILKASNCKVVLASKSHEHLLDDARAEVGNVERITVPDLSYFINDQAVEHYPFDKEYEQGLEDINFVMQTSGTTGNAKLLFRTGKDEKRLSLESGSDYKEGMAFRELSKDAHCLQLLPLSWSAGFAFSAVFPVTIGIVPILLPGSAPLPMTPEYLNEAMIHCPKGDKNALVIVPDVLRAMAQVPEYFEQLKTLDWIGFAGAPLDHSVGDKLSRFTRIQSLMGNTEIGQYPLLLNDPADWKIHRFHPSMDGYHFQHFTDDLYELCVTKEPGDTRPAFQLNPDIDVFHTKDLFRSVPGREGYWQNAGRSDDFVKLATLSKFNAIEIEQIINRHPEVETCIVGGDARKRPFALIQTSSHVQGTTEEIIDKVWPAIEDANQIITEEARLQKDLVLLVRPDALIKRTIKGTVDRLNTLAMYTDDIDALYIRAGYK